VDQGEILAMRCVIPRVVERPVVQMELRRILIRPRPLPGRETGSAPGPLRAGTSSRKDRHLPIEFTGVGAPVAGGLR